MLTDRDTLIAIFKAAVQSVDPYKSVVNQTNYLINSYNAGKYERLYVLSFGKAACTMARAAIDSIGELVTGGIVITKYGHADNFSGDKMKIFEAGHPVPDENGYRATKEAVNLLGQSDERTLLLCLISGGGSSLLVAPYPGISLEDKQEITKLLLRSGADIYEMNAVRKHISMIKGGRLAAIAHPARIESLILSDVLGDRLDVIASGPVVPDETTFEDAWKVLQKYQIDEELPVSVTRTLRDGMQGLIPETPKPGDQIFREVNTRIVGNNLKAIEAGKKKAEQLGFDVIIVDTAMHGEARNAGAWLANKVLTHGRAKDKPVCFISGGETTVSVHGNGTGGRNMELALAFAIKVEGHEGISLLSAGTDGGDGPTDAAGAIIDGLTVSRGELASADAVQYLDNNDSYSYFKKTNELLITGPTGTNVMDLQIALMYE